MGDKKWTNEQWAAITTRDTNLLVAAAAGAGKTAVLVERIIKLITNPDRPVDVDQLLVVTFTNAAAAEMRERIGAALGKALKENPHSKRLARQLAMLNKASITTLHSFCLDLLRRYFYLLDLDPGFRVADEVEAELLRLEVLEELFEERYSRENNEVFALLVDTYGGERDDVKLQELVLALYRFSSSHPWPKDWLEGLADNFALGEEQSLEDLPRIREIKEGLSLEMQSVLGLLKQAAWWARQPGGPEPYCKNLAQDIIQLEPLVHCGDMSWDKLYRSFSSITWGNLAPCRGQIDDGLKEKVQGFRNRAKDKVKEIINTYFSAEPGVLLQDLRSLHPLVKELAALTVDFIDRYQKKKQSKGLVDFGDLEHYCLSILLDKASNPGESIPSAVALQLKQQFAEVLVDEYQDINAVQETVLQLVSRPDNRFMVGDVKQSIYRFRLAEPGLFLAKYQQYGTPGSADGCRIDLSKNFRSRLDVVHAVNFVFRQIMTRAAGEIDYDAAAELRWGAEFPAAEEVTTAQGPVELHLIDSKEAQADPGEPSEAVDDHEMPEAAGEPEELSTDQAEARLVGRRILEMVKGKGLSNQPEFMVWDKELARYRPVNYRDIVILLRATSGRANTFLEELRAMGIPTYAELGTGYFEAIEVETFVSLLKVIDNPRQDVPLAAVLRSPMVGLRAEELAEIRLCNTDGEFYDAVRDAARAALGGVSHKLRDFLVKLEQWRSQARRGPLADLIWLLYRETGYYDFVGSLTGGTQCQANLRVLYHRAKQFEATSFRGLFRFLRFVERMRDAGSDMGSARTLGESEDVVRVMSIHKSKGLEFPVAFVAGLGKKFNLKDLSKELLMHKEWGLGPQVINLATRVSYPSLPKLLLRQQIKKEAVAEEMRVLYVALTRAREKLIMVGSVRGLEKSLEKWCASAAQIGWPLPDAELMAAKTYLDWLCPAVARHRDGRALLQMTRSEAEPASEVAADDSSWQAFFYNINQIQHPQPDNQQQVAELLESVKGLAPLADQGQAAEVERRLGWTYPLAEVTAKPAKAAVTEIKRWFDELVQMEEDVLPYRQPINGRPKFMQQHKGLTPAERGSAIHLVMQHISLAKMPSRQDIDGLLEALVAREILLPEQAAVIDPAQITGFFASPLGQRVLKALKVQRELPFSLALPAGQVYPELAQSGVNEKVLVQGVIDCLVDEGDGLLLIDYKSDTVRPGQPSVAERYRGQINLYTRAIQDILGKPVKEKAIYLFDNGETIYF